MVKAGDVQKLRDLTGAGVLDCKNALEEASGDLDVAKKIIFEKGLLKAERKTERKTGAGILETYIHNGRIGVLLELRCETDFVARSEPFRWLAHELAMQIAAIEPADITVFLSQPYVKDESTTIDQLIKGVISKTGENIRVDKFCRYEI
ncbi:MAG: translation elongation factor Ts [Patescibacteria group bacterium]